MVTRRRRTRKRKTRKGGSFSVKRKRESRESRESPCPSKKELKHLIDQLDEAYHIAMDQARRQARNGVGQFEGYDLTKRLADICLADYDEESKCNICEAIYNALTSGEFSQSFYIKMAEAFYGKNSIATLKNGGLINYQIGVEEKLKKLLDIEDISSIQEALKQSKELLDMRYENRLPKKTRT